MKNLIFAIMGGLLLVLFQTTNVFGADEAAMVEGKVVEINSDQITINPKEALFFQRMNLEVNPDTQLENFVSVQDLEQGDEIKVHYVERDGRKVASHIARTEAEMDFQDDQG